MLRVNLDLHRMIELNTELLFHGDQLPGLAMEAVNTTMEELQELATEEIRQDINAPREEIAKRVGAFPAKRFTRLFVQGALYLRSLPIRLKHMGAVQAPEGVWWQPYRSGSRRLIRKAFGPNVPRLGRGVFKRVGRSRTPIRRQPGFKLRGDRVAEAALQRTGRMAEELLQANVDRLAAKMLNAVTSGQTPYGIHYIEESGRLTGNFGVGVDF